MLNLNSPSTRHAALSLLAAATLAACGGSTSSDFPLPTEPRLSSIYEIETGPIDRASAFNVVSGRGAGQPRVVRVDANEQWDVAFGVLDGDPVWLPRGFFEGFEPTSGITEVKGASFEQVTVVPDAAEAYEHEQPVPVSVGTIYAIRSRSDPTLSFPCRIYAKLIVDSVEGDPALLTFRYLWNPNCDQATFPAGQ